MPVVAPSNSQKSPPPNSHPLSSPLTTDTYPNYTTQKGKQPVPNPANHPALPTPPSDVGPSSQPPSQDGGPQGGAELAIFRSQRSAEVIKEVEMREGRVADALEKGVVVVEGGGGVEEAVLARARELIEGMEGLPEE